jgi:hypothetical protein
VNQLDPRLRQRDSLADANSYFMPSDASSLRAASACSVRLAQIAANSDEHCVFALVLIFLRSLMSSVASTCVSTKRRKRAFFVARVASRGSVPPVGNPRLLLLPSGS